MVLLTPESLSRPWIAFEDGFGAATASDKVAPVSLGLDIRGGILMPFSMYQTYQLTDVHSVDEFLSRVLKVFSYTYDPRMAACYVKPAVEKFLKF